MTEELQDIMNTNTFLKSIIFRSVTLCVWWEFLMGTMYDF